MAGSINGIGTTYYGKRSIQEDGSYIATKWFILLMFPIVPLGSYRLRELQVKRDFGLTTTEYVAQRVPLCWWQVIGTYVAAILAVAFLVGFWILVSQISVGSEVKARMSYAQGVTEDQRSSSAKTIVVASSSP
jgi:hypothetical protein